MPTVFLSHSSRDKKTAKRLAIDIMMSNIFVWFDEWEIHVGHSITQKISRGLDDVDFVVVLLSKNSVESGWVQKEWATKIGEEATSQSVSVLPVLLEDCSIPSLLRDKKYADIRENYEDGVRELLGAIKFHAASEKPVTAGGIIQSGRIVYDHSMPDVPILRGLINSIERGFFERSENGLKAHVQIVSSHKSMQDLGDRMGSNRLELFCPDFCVSGDPNKPSLFKCVQEFTLPRGETLTDITTGRSSVLPFNMSGISEISVEAYTESGMIKGKFIQKVNYKEQVPIPSLQVFGTFMAVVAL